MNFQRIWEDRSGKHFSPGGRKILKYDFQRLLKSKRGKFQIALNLLHEYGLAPRIYLGAVPLFDVKDLALAIYDNNIHPVFFVDALHLIASLSTSLSPLLEKAQLQGLGCKSIAEGLSKGKIKKDDLSVNFSAFREKTVQKRLEILCALNVLKLKKGAVLPPDMSKQPPKD